MICFPIDSLGDMNKCEFRLGKQPSARPPSGQGCQQQQRSQAKFACAFVRKSDRTALLLRNGNRRTVLVLGNSAKVATNGNERSRLKRISDNQAINVGEAVLLDPTRRWPVGI